MIQPEVQLRMGPEEEIQSARREQPILPKPPRFIVMGQQDNSDKSNRPCHLTKKSTNLTPRVDKKKQCPSCPYSTPYSSTFKRHVKSHNGFKCDKCEFSTKKKGNLRRHINMLHSEAEEVSCDCGKAFKDRVHLQVRRD